MLTVLSVLMCISINVNNIVYSCKICHVNVNNKGSASQCDICQSWVHESVKCNQLNHIDYKYLQGSDDLWYCFSCCIKIFPFGTLTNKDFMSSTTNSLSIYFSQGAHSDNDNESLLSLKPPSNLVLL